MIYEIFIIDCIMTEQLTRTVNTEAIRGVSHNFPFIIRPVKLAEFPTQRSGAISLPVFVTLVMMTLVRVRELLRPLHFTYLLHIGILPRPLPFVFLYILPSRSTCSSSRQ